MGVRGALRRHRVSIASGLALAVAAAGVLTYAMSADGYRAHDAQLNDGGIWVTNNTDGFYGRINKPIGQLDGALFAKLSSSLDIVQDGAAVIGVNASDGLVAPIDPASLVHPEGEQAGVPADADIALAGGTLAVADPADGRIWATRVLPGEVPSVFALDQQSDPVAKVGAGAAMTVTRAGVIVAVSAEKDRVTRIRPEAGGWAKPATSELGAEVGDGVGITAVGETAVLVDAGRLTVVGGGSGDVPADATLQQPGPDADTVLLASGTELLEADLSSGDLTTLTEGVSGTQTAPVRVGDCVFGAWSGGSGTVATLCGGGEPAVAGLGGEASNLVFRVNRGEIVLNDKTSGAVWQVEADEPTRLDNWQDFLRPDKEEKDNKDNEKEDTGDRRPPQAKPDRFGARPGRLTVLHPLDNDTAPPGRILAIRSVEVGKDTPVTISPDGQTLQILLPEQSAGTTFEYYIDDGRSDVSAHATVTVNARAATANSAPHLRQHFEDRIWTVPAGGVLDVPLLPDWRDNEDGDPLTVESAVARGGETSGADARITGSGRVRFRAPATGGLVDVTYAVSDGEESTSNELRFRVQDPTERQAVPAVAEPDIVAGEVGQPITIRPLGNDLPGSDPVTPDAQMALGGRIATSGGAQVRTDLAEGAVTFTSEIAKSYFLDYDVAFGGAAFAPGRIRVDVRPRQSPPPVPVAMPDTVTLRGQSATLVDVLANDVDPTGGLLVVQRAEARTANQLDVAVVAGRWLRISASQGQLLPNPQVVRYSITNGTRSGADGEVVVRQEPPPEDNTPVTEVDRVTVRAGAGAGVPVLDNDFSPSGDSLSLVGHVAGEKPGQLTVQRPDDEKVPTGEAFVAGRVVRYVAPAALEEAQTFAVRYIATNETGETAPGRIEVEVIPLDQENRAPEPPVLEGRVVSGDTLKLKLPGAGVDPDGDSVTLLGLGTPTDGEGGAPELGRVVRFGADSLRYQAYPGSQGTEEFTYQVTDSFGAVATGTARIAIVPPGPPQPPLAVNDAMTVEPGRRVTVDVLANDLVAAGDRVEVQIVDAPDGVELESPTGPLLMDAPDQVGGRNLEVVYSISNGLDSSRATVTLRTAEPYNNPPVVFDAFGPNAEGDVVSVDVLATAYDPDGSADDLTITDVLAPAGVQASAAGPRITVTRGPQPIVVPFRVEDADEGAATASLYVPATGSGLPYVKADGQIRLDPGESKKLDLGDYVVDPGGGQVSFTLTDRIWASPLGEVSSEVTGERGFTVQAAGGYEGPGAVTFEVTTGDSVDDPDGIRAVLSVPVQVGDPKPILRCPEDAIEIAQGESLDLDIATLCHVWTAEAGQADSLDYEGSWAKDTGGLSVTQDGAPVIEVAARGDVRPGAEGVLEVAADGSEPGRIRIRVVKSPPPSLSPIRVADLRAGEERVIDLARYLRPGVTDPEPTVIEAVQITGLDVKIVKEGASSVRLTTGERVDGRAEFRVVMGDAGAGSGPERRVEGRIALDILDAPDRPLAPVPGRTVRSKEVHLVWRAPAANGAPIDSYEVRSDTGKVTRCGSTTCDVTALTNGRWYTFTVRAHNAVGWSEWSRRSARARPDAKPGPVGTITMTSRGDHTVTLAWKPPSTQTSAIAYYDVTWPGGSAQPTRPTVTVRGLDNNKAHLFKVRARNALDFGPTRQAEFQSIGKPTAPTNLRVTPETAADDTTAVTFAWDAVSPPNGPGDVRYTVRRNGQPVPSCVKTANTYCTNTGVAYDGTEYTYTVTAFNEGGKGLESDPASTTWKAIGEPSADWGAWSVKATGNDNQAKATYTGIPSSRGAQSTVKVLVDGSEVVPTSVTNTGATFNVPGNGVFYDIRMLLCNESTCTPSSTSRTERTYGPHRTSHVLSTTPHSRENPDGTYQVWWDVRVTTNGDPAQVHIKGESDFKTVRNDWVGAPSHGEYAFTTREVNIDAGTSEVLWVSLKDDDPVRAESAPAEDRYYTPERTPPSVQIRKGSSCSDVTDDPRCNKDGTGLNCVVSGCRMIEFTTQRFARSTIDCTMYDDSDHDGKFEPYKTRPVTSNTTTEPGFYYGMAGETIYAVCMGVESNRITW